MSWWENAESAASERGAKDTADDYARIGSRRIHINDLPTRAELAQENQ